MVRIFALILTGVAITTLGQVGVAEAYVGPGAGLSAIGSLIALVSAVIVALLGFVWFPVKRLLRSLRKSQSPAKPAAAQPNEDATPAAAKQ